MATVLCGTLTLACASRPAPSEKGSGVRSEIDAFARRALRQIGTTPGLTVVVVENDRVVYRGDFGLRDVEARLPVTADTRFYLASSTKAFTAMAAAILAADGKVDLDAPIRGVWPNLELTPPLDAGRISLRDLLAMRSGLANDTVEFRMDVGNIEDERELLRLLATYSRREPRTFRYSNLSYVLAGRILERAAGESWSDLVRDEVLAPLGMSSTVTGPPLPTVPVVKCYRYRAPDTFVETPAELTPLVGPAGGMLTTSADAGRWLIAMINEGRIGGRQALPARAVRSVQSEQTTNRKRYRYFDRFAWGLGQDLGEYEGDLIVHRFGGLNGAYSHVSFMPEHRIGVAVLANGGGAVPDAVAAFAYDVLLGRKDRDARWSAELGRVAAAVAEDRERRRQSDASSVAARRSAGHALDRYVATYHYDRLGDIQVTQREERLHAQLGLFRAELIPIGEDAFLVDWRDSGSPARVEFVFDGSGRASRIDWGGRIFDRVP
ncbi:MAG: serine hydrolase [Acidobacteriota bacterium]